MSPTLMLLAALLSAPVFAAPDHQNPRKLTGTYSIGTASLVDPAANERSDVLLRLHLTGEAARDLYGALPSKPRRDACFDDGTMTKASGTILCSRHPTGMHACWIGVDLTRKALASAFVC